MHHSDKGHGFAFKPNVLQALIDTMEELAHECRQFADRLHGTQEKDIGEDQTQLNPPLNALAEDVILYGQRLGALMVRLDQKVDRALKAPEIK